jgi:hypothetical protein
MCDYSLSAVKTRPAKVDDKLTTRLFGWSTRGFAASEDKNVAVCLLPGTELSFAEEGQEGTFVAVAFDCRPQDRNLPEDQSK